jgi:hypothetical protein
MPILAGLMFAVQFCFAFHALKTGRPYWWIFLIMGFPVMGCVIYYLVEVYPGSRQERSAHRAARRIVKALQPDADLKRRAEELEVCGSIDNKLALAEECFNHQMYAEAIKLYESCLSGAYKHDGAILLELARSAVEGGDWDKALATLARLEAEAPQTRPGDVRLLKARVLQGQQHNDAALALYRELIPAFTGLEARYRYATFLSELGQHETSLHVFNEMIAHAKRFPSLIEEEQQWARAAREAVSNAARRK